MNRKHIFVCGAKGIGQYGGFETFTDKLTEYHQNHQELCYHVACKANGNGAMDETLLQGAVPLPAEDGTEQFLYHSAHCFKIRVPEIGPAQAVFYDVAAVRFCIRYCRKHGINNPVIYVLACRLGPFIGMLKRSIKAIGGELVVNPDGHEWQRGKWSLPIKCYWKASERKMIAAADHVVCDSRIIEDYVRNTYKKTALSCIAYGAETTPSVLADDDPAFHGWMSEFGLEKDGYYLVVCRFEPENSFREILSAFMKSHTDRKLALITTENPKLFRKLERELHFRKDSRICFTGTVYDQELLKKIRENAFAYIHGHTVGGTNPTLLEAMAQTKVNLLRDVPFNREVGGDAALYWKETDLTELLEKTDSMTTEERDAMEGRAKERIRSAYSWKHIAEQYLKLWRTGNEE